MSWWISLPPVTDSWQLSLRHLTLQPCHFSAYNINTNLCILLPHISTHIRFQVLTAVCMKMTAFLDTARVISEQTNVSDRCLLLPWSGRWITQQDYTALHSRRLSSSYQHILQWIPTQVLHHWTTAEVHNFLTPLYVYTQFRHTVRYMGDYFLWLCQGMVLPLSVNTALVAAFHSQSQSDVYLLMLQGMLKLLPTPLKLYSGLWGTSRWIISL
jgi:hypothetical protein